MHVRVTSAVCLHFTYFLTEIHLHRKERETKLEFIAAWYQGSFPRRYQKQNSSLFLASWASTPVVFFVFFFLLSSAAARLFQTDHILIIHHLFLPRCLSSLSSPFSLPSVLLSRLKAWLGGNSPPSTSDPITLSCPSLVGCSSVPPRRLSLQRADDPSLSAATSLLTTFITVTYTHRLRGKHTPQQARMPSDALKN